MKQTPLHTGKVQIGLTYEPPRFDTLSADAELLQSALLARSGPRRNRLVSLMIDAAWWAGSLGLMLLVVHSPELFSLLTGG